MPLVRSLEGGCPSASSGCVSPGALPSGTAFLCWLVRSLQCLSDLLPASCSGLAAGVAFHLSERNKEYTVHQRVMHAYVSRKMGEAIEDLYILVLAKFDDFLVGFWCGPCGLGSACLVIPSGCQLLPVSLCFS